AAGAARPRAWRGWPSRASSPPRRWKCSAGSIPPTAPACSSCSSPAGWDSTAGCSTRCRSRCGARRPLRGPLDRAGARGYTGSGGLAMFTPKKTIGQLVAEAKQRIENVTVEQLEAELARGDTQLLDIRDVRERQKLGWIPGSLHVPRGMLEFWLDPTSPYYSGK